MSRRRCAPKRVRRLAMGEFDPGTRRVDRCMFCGDQVDEVEEMPSDFGSSSPVHRRCADWAIEAMRAQCPVCTGELGLDYDHDLWID
jgi:hypothetical protein